MKIVKIIFGVLAGLWAFGILLKFLRRLPLILNSPLGFSSAMGALAGIILFTLLSFVLLRSAFGKKTASSEL